MIFPTMGLNKSFLSNKKFTIFKDNFSSFYVHEPYNCSTDQGIEYCHNISGRRCDNFSKETAQENFLFAGCSYTYGTGLPYQHTWAYKLNKDLNGENFYNVGMPARNFQVIINDIYTYIRLFGKPKTIFLLLPDLKRDHVVRLETNLEQGDYYEVYPIVSMSFNSKDPENQSSNKKDHQYLNMEKVYYDFYNTMSQLEDYLESLKIPFLWTTWDELFQKSLAGEKIFKNYFELDSLEEYVEKNIYPPAELGKNRKYWLIAADKPYPHPGIMEQQFYASQFFKKFDEIKKV
jgi:hypothetical protein